MALKDIQKGFGQKSTKESGPLGPLVAELQSHVAALERFTGQDARQLGIPEDGTTDATASLNAALSAGLNLSLTPGGLYLVSGPLLMASNQILFGNGATLNRAAQVHTTTTTPIVSGSTFQIVVASATGLRVGMQITVTQSGLFDQSNRTIVDVYGNQITLSSAIVVDSGGSPVNLSGTVDVYASFNVIDMGSDCRVFDVRIDGNRSNWAFYRWQITREIQTGGSRCVVKGCRLENAPGEGIYVTGGDYHRFHDCWVVNSNGNGFHLSGTNDPVITSCRVDTVNLDTSVGHANGCITWSRLIGDATVSDCYLANGIAGIASISGSDNSDVTVHGCTIRNCTSFGIQVDGGDVNPGRLVFTGNRIYNCVQNVIQNVSNTPTVFPNRIILSNNYIDSTRTLISQAQWVSVTDNIFEWSSSTTSVVLDIAGSSNILIEGNQINGGGYGVYVDDATGTGPSVNVMINNNLLTGQQFNAIRFQASDLINCQAIGNSISNTVAASTGYDGLLVNSKCSARFNTINVVKGHAGIYPQNGAFVENNTVHSAGASNAVRIDGGTTGMIVRNNLTDVAIVDNGSNTLSGNLTIP